MLHLSFPDISHKEEYEKMLVEWKEFEVTPISPGALFRGENFEEFLRIAKDDLISNRHGVPATLFFFMDDTHIIGAVQIRHHINHPNLIEAGGHIGYGLRPSARGKGLAKEMLRLGLIEIKKLGLERVLICAHDDNPPSYKTIEANRGIFERYTEHQGKKSRRYWITIA